MKPNKNSKEVSNKVRKMKIIMDSLFTDNEKHCISALLSDYKKSRNVLFLAENIMPYIDTKAKWIFVRSLFDIIPVAHKDLFANFYMNRGINILTKESSSLHDKQIKLSSTYPRIHNFQQFDQEEDDFLMFLDEDLTNSPMDSYRDHFIDESAQYAPKMKGLTTPPPLEIPVSDSNIESRHLLVHRLTRLSARIDESCQSLGGCLATWGVTWWRSHATFSVYVRHVDDNCYMNKDAIELIDRDCIKIGQRLIQINGIQVVEMNDEDLIEILDNSSYLDLLLQGEGLDAHNIYEEQNYSSFRWVDYYNDRICSPPIPHKMTSHTILGRSTKSRLDGKLLKPLELILPSNKAQILGVNIRGGKEFGIGLFVSSVHSGSLAEMIGLKPGDKILQVNSLSVSGRHTPYHKQAVHTIKSSAACDLWVYSLGKLPLTSANMSAKSAPGNNNTTASTAFRSKSTGRQNQWQTNQQRSQHSVSEYFGDINRGTHNSRSRDINPKIVERQLLNVISQQDSDKIMYLLRCYYHEELNVRQLVVAIHNSINGLWKRPLLHTLLQAVLPSDRVQFQMQLEVLHSVINDKTFRMQYENVMKPGLPNSLYSQRDININRKSSRRRLTRSTEQLSLDPGSEDPEGEHTMMHSMNYQQLSDRKNESLDCEIPVIVHTQNHSAIDSSRSTNVNVEPVNQAPSNTTKSTMNSEVNQINSSVETFKIEEDNSNNNNSTRSQPEQLNSSIAQTTQSNSTENKDVKKHLINELKKLVAPKNEIPSRQKVTKLVNVDKVCAKLGIAIEGGVNTSQALPRIITVEPDSCAHKCGELEAGDVLLEVNGNPLAGLEHSKIVRRIGEAFKHGSSSDPIQFLIMKSSTSTTNCDDSIPDD